MTDHRRIQRTLFRMQMDPGFAAAVFAGEPEALATTELSSADAELLRGADAAGVGADLGDKRKNQLLGNVASEFVLSVATAPDGFLEAFLRSPEFHGAIANGGRLPHAFGDYAQRVAGDAGDRARSALATLELFLVDARRAERPEPALAANELALGPRAALVRLPAGTFELASLLRSALDAGDPLPRTGELGSDEETVLVVAEPRPSPHRLAEVRPERLEPAVAALLERAGRAFPRPDQEVFAGEMGASLEEFDEFVESLVSEGILSRGSAP